MYFWGGSWEQDLITQSAIWMEKQCMKKSLLLMPFMKGYKKFGGA